MKYKNIYGIPCIVGAVIWALTLVLRETELANILFIRTLLNHAPNLSVVWISFYMFSAVYIDVTYLYFFYRKRNTSRVLSLKMIFYINSIILVILVAVEYLYIFIKGTRFCIWDILVSLFASIVIVGIALFFRKHDDLSFLVGKGRES